MFYAMLQARVGTINGIRLYFSFIDLSLLFHYLFPILSLELSIVIDIIDGVILYFSFIEYRSLLFYYQCCKRYH